MLDVFLYIGLILLFLAIGFLLSCLVRRFGAHTLINGFMSKEKADEVFPGWRKKKKKDSNQKDKKT